MGEIWLSLDIKFRLPKVLIHHITFPFNHFRTQNGSEKRPGIKIITSLFAT